MNRKKPFRNQKEHMENFLKLDVLIKKKKITYKVCELVNIDNESEISIIFKRNTFSTDTTKS